MGLIQAPGYKLTANDADITAKVADRFISLHLTDESGENADKLEVVLSDHDPANPLKIPKTGAELRLALGYDGALQQMGMYVCDEVEIDEWPGRMTIIGRSAVFDQTPKGRTEFQTQKTRHWPNGTTIGAMVAKMAKEHGMTAAVSPVLAGIKLPPIAQQDESDINLLIRLGKKYDAIAKPAGGKLVFAKRGDGKTASGQALPRVSIVPSSDTKVRYHQTTRNSAGTVVAYYHDHRAAKRHEVKVGTGEPVKRIKMYYRTADEALAAAKAEMAKRARADIKLHVTMPGDPRIRAESILVLSGFRDGFNGEWLVTRAEHELSKSNGYRMEVDCERPNANADVQKLTTGTTADGTGDNAQ